MKTWIIRNCPLCGKNNFKIKYKRNYAIEELGSGLFSARRKRGKKCYEHNTIVKCENCGMVYMNPLLNPIITEKLYKESKYNYGAEEENLKKSYGNYLKLALKYLKKPKRLLDIGTGNGFFLEEAIVQEYRDVWGIEPSHHAVISAKPHLKKIIIEEILKPEQFSEGYFDVITLFQVLDHIENPEEVIKICKKFLKTGGVLICISHNVNSLSAKIMGERSPIFDIEHTHLFSKKTISNLLTKNKFKILEIGSSSNTYSLGYWINFSPIPEVIKSKLVSFLKMLKLESVKISIRPGNFFVIARNY